MEDKHQSDRTVSERTNEIYFAATEIEDVNERNAFIETSCADNNEIRREIERLFKLQDRATAIFDKHCLTQMPASEMPQGIPRLPEYFKLKNSLLSNDEGLGKQVGKYKLLKKIGEGGVSNVYLAEQIEPVRRQVALKIIKPGMDTRSIIARFEAERQALGMMEHPNVACVLDAGETETGRPFFVMELVHGERITTYCDTNRLSIPQRLKLFIQVCNAIQHAHQKGIIHRDIKPSNVLVTQHDGTPSPIVIDFGIAKATTPDLLTEKTINTSVGPIIGTPAYMSPEQTNLTQTNVDTRSDIYSLGTLLYELLIGKPPFDHEKLLKNDLGEMCRILREEDPPSLLTRFQEMSDEEQKEVTQNRNIEPRPFLTILRNDLSWILMKSMEKDREQRYESVSDMAVEIQRFLNHEPIIARPPSRMYRLQKLVRRNRATFAYLTAIGIALLAGLGTSTWLFFKERDARKSEMRLLVEADARAKIAQAALLLSRGAFAEADQMMKQVEIPVVEPSLEATSVFRALAQWNVTQGRWETAAECFLKLQQANQLDKSNTTTEITRDLLGAGPALIVAEKQNEYRVFVKETLGRFFGTSDPSAAEQVIKNSLILPTDKDTLQRLAPFVKIVQDAINADEPYAHVNSYLLGWRTLALALYEYRSDDFDRARYWAERSLKYADRDPPRVALSHLVLAMAQTKLGDREQARTTIVGGEKLIENKLPEGTEHIPGIGNANSEGWHDWVIAYLLLQEANRIVRAD
ncbi:MAG: serine/threonine protein kinase [Lentisphaerae bacterium]|nr:serine/threonine protein kinase [Lentisphaerota bacterium]